MSISDAAEIILDKEFGAMVLIIKCFVISPNAAVQLPRAAAFKFSPDYSWY
jgi:hypothetical protein